MKKCTECQEEFNPVLAKQEFCSNKCRQKSFRRKKMQEVLKLKSELEKLKSSSIENMPEIKASVESTLLSIRPKGLHEKTPVETSEIPNQKWSLRRPIMKVPEHLKGVARDLWIANWKKENK